MMVIIHAWTRRSAGSVWTGACFSLNTRPGIFR